MNATDTAPKRRDQIKKLIVEWMLRAGLGTGERIPSQVKFAQLLGTTELTAHRALAELSQDGVVERVKGKGTFVGTALAALYSSNRHFSLILPGKGLDRPESNPESWPYVQMILRCFIGYAGATRVFSPRAVTSKESAAQVADDLRGHAAVFFLHKQDEWGLFDRLVGERIAPTVCLGLPHPSRPCLTVDHDRVNGARLGVAHLIGLGYRRIGFVGSSEFWGQLSFEGYRQAHREAALDVAAERNARTGERRADGALGAERLLAQAPDCDAIFVDSDMRALGVLDHLRAADVPVPEDMGVMGYDGLDLAVTQPPHLASVRIPWERMVAAAMDELTRCDGAASPVKHVSILGEVVAGETVRRVEDAP